MKAFSRKLESFPPILPRNPKVLILGSMPGRQSLLQQQYYAHPHNLFWSIMGKICDAGPDRPYAQRISKLREAGIALWDVIRTCRRRGSLDQNIKDEVPNEIVPLLHKYPNMRAIFFNGQKAYQSFHSLVLSDLPESVLNRFSLVTLPSSSPANASIPKNRKLERWNDILSYI